MLKNGKSSCGSKSRHIHIRYFFSKDVVEREDMEILHCPTDEMIANFYIKLLQGKQYYNLRQLIMGHSPLVVEERVERKTESTTIDRTGKPVSKAIRRELTTCGYKVSNNFH